jgi:hypothetical protein
MLNAVTVVLTIIQKLLPTITTSATIQTIVDAIVALTPIVIAEYSQLLPIVQNIIAVLQQSGDITDDQITALEAASAAIDAHFDATAAAARAADAAAKLGGLTPAT